LQKNVTENGKSFITVMLFYPILEYRKTIFAAKHMRLSLAITVKTLLLVTISGFKYECL